VVAPGVQCITKDEPATGRRIVAGVHWDYDCYGGNLKKKLGLPTMMPTWEKDYHAGRKLLEMNNLQVFEAPIHLEGGSIHSDGQG
jgi:agmatine deiminase